MRTTLGLLGILVLAACGGKVSTVDDSSGADSPAPTATGTARPPRGSSPPSTGFDPGAPSPGKQPPPPPTEKAVYTAHAWPGGLDHLEVAKADYTNDICTRIYLTNPGSEKQFPFVSAPSDWGVQNVLRTAGVNGCTAGDPSKEGAQATDGKGNLSWKEVPGVYLPCTLSIHAVMLFTGAPTQVSFDAENVPVKGCQ